MLVLNLCNEIFKLNVRFRSETRLGYYGNVCFVLGLLPPGGRRRRHLCALLRVWSTDGSAEFTSESDSTSAVDEDHAKDIAEWEGNSEE